MQIVAISCLFSVGSNTNSANNTALFFYFEVHKSLDMSWIFVRPILIVYILSHIMHNSVAHSVTLSGLIVEPENRLLHNPSKLLVRWMANNSNFTSISDRRRIINLDRSDLKCVAMIVLFDKFVHFIMQNL